MLNVITVGKIFSEAQNLNVTEICAKLFCEYYIEYIKIKDSYDYKL